MMISELMKKTWKNYLRGHLLVLLVACGAGDPSETSEKASQNSGNPEIREFSEIGELSQKLFLAARVGALDQVVTLVQQGASINQSIKGKNGEITPLLTAIIMGHANVAHYLVAQGADRSKTFRGYGPDEFYVHKGLHRTGNGNMFLWSESDERGNK